MRGLVATLLGLTAAALVAVSSDAASYQNAVLPAKRAAAPNGDAAAGAGAGATALEPVAVVGTGKMGSAIAELLCAGGVPVHLVSRSPQKAMTAASAISSKQAQCRVTAAVSPAEALQSAGVVVLTSPFSGTADWLRANRDALIARDDRVVVDISNPWRSGEGIAPDAAILSGVELHRQALGHEGTQFVAAFKNNFARRQLEHATGKQIVEFAVDLAGDARARFERLMSRTRLKPVFRGEISKGAAATLEAEVRARACVRCSWGNKKGCLIIKLKSRLNDRVPAAITTTTTAPSEPACASRIEELSPRCLTYCVRVRACARALVCLPACVLVQAGPFRPDLKAKHAQFSAAVRRRAGGEL